MEEFPEWDETIRDPEYKTATILFLDIDGVLNIMDGSIYNTCYLMRKSAIPNKYMEEFAVARLNHIVKETDCDIVISSSWRSDMEMLKEEMERVGFKYWNKVIDRTPFLSSRGEEILEWISGYETKHNCTVYYCVLEDEPHDLHGIPQEYIVQPNFRDALTSKDMEDVIAILL